MGCRMSDVREPRVFVYWRTPVVDMLYCHRSVRYIGYDVSAVIPGMTPHSRSNFKVLHFSPLVVVLVGETSF